MSEENQKTTKIGANRVGFNWKETCSPGKIAAAIREASDQKTGINSDSINTYLNNCAVGNFLGCYAQDELRTIYIKSLPVFIIVNFDHSYSSGTHWIAIRIDKKRLEIWDPLGFNYNRWPNIPFLLLDFLHKYSHHRNVYLCPEIQPLNSTLCGFYCIFFVIFRSCNTFRSCTSYFSKFSANDKILRNFFK